MVRESAFRGESLKDNVDTVVRIFHPSREHIMRMKIFLPAILSTSMALSVIPAIASAEPFTIKIDDLSHGHFSNEQVYGGFGCHGNNVSPRISWAHVPRGTKSIVVTIFDPDAPTGGLGWTHWEIANIPPSESSLEKGASGNPKRLPPGSVETLTDFGEIQNMPNNFSLACANIDPIVIAAGSAGGITVDEINVKCSIDCSYI